MTSNSRRTAFVVLTMYAVALMSCFFIFTCDARPARAADPPLPLRRSAAPPLSAVVIQQQLDATGYFFVPPGRTAIDSPIRVRSGQTLAGAGFASQLILTTGETAIEFGAPGPTALAFYGAVLKDVQLVGGGVRVHQMAQHCWISGVWVSEARGSAFVVDGIGERLLLRDCIAWEASQHGFVIRAADGQAYNGITLEHCNAQVCGGAGVLIIADGPTAQITQTRVIDCTIQGNQQTPDLAKADVVIRGFVGDTAIRDCWIESPGKTGLVAEPITWLRPRQLALDRYVGNLEISGKTVISQCSPAAQFSECYAASIEQLWVQPATAQVVWSRWQPGGAQRLLQPAQLVDSDTLPTASTQPAPTTSQPIHRVP